MSAMILCHHQNTEGAHSVQKKNGARYCYFLSKSETMLLESPSIRSHTPLPHSEFLSVLFLSSRTRSFSSSCSNISRSQGSFVFWRNSAVEEGEIQPPARFYSMDFIISIRSFTLSHTHILKNRQHVIKIHKTHHYLCRKKTVMQ